MNSADRYQATQATCRVALHTTNMTNLKISNGQIHKTPLDVKKLIGLSKALHTTWEDITPLARNEWICWIESAKQDETRTRRMRIMSENLVAGKRRPCCWAGCVHR